MRPSRAVLAIALAAIAGSAYAGRPLDTDDATIVDEGWCQLESWVFGSNTTTRYWLVPACNPFGNLELKAGYAREQPDGAPGHNDYVLEAKTLLKPLAPNEWGFGLSASAVRAGGGEDRTWGYTALFIASRSLADDRVRLHGNAGMLYTQRTRRLSGLWGIAGELDITERVTVLGEVVGVSGEGRLAQVGGRVWLVPERVYLDGTIGRSDISGPTHTVFTFGVYFAGPVW
jgi:hypothetical protein